MCEVLCEESAMSERKANRNDNKICVEEYCKSRKASLVRDLAGELQETQGRLKRLEAVIDANPDSIDDRNKELLRKQHGIMLDLADILKQRIVANL